MMRKILIGTLIVLSSTFLILSILGIALAWVYNEPLTKKTTARLREVDSQLAQIQTDLRNAKAEGERALRIIKSVEKALAELTQQAADAKTLLEDVNATLDDKLIPGLATTRTNITEVRSTLEDFRATLESINSIPFINLNLPGDELLLSIINQVDLLEGEIVNIQDLAKRASTFIGDTSYLFGGDFDETKQKIEELVLVLAEYDQKVTDWRGQIADILESMPRWIDNASLALTLGLLWFGFSQFGLILHGLGMRRGSDPLAVLRMRTKPESSQDIVI